MVTMAKTMAAVAAFAVVTSSIGSAPGLRLLSRSRSHLQPLCRRILPTTRTIMMIMLLSSHWQIFNYRAMDRAVLLVIVPGGGPTLLRLSSHPARRDGGDFDLAADDVDLRGAAIFWNNERHNNQQTNPQPSSALDLEPWAIFLSSAWQGAALHPWSCNGFFRGPHYPVYQVDHTTLRDGHISSLTA